jgi:hypothetical protein
VTLRTAVRCARQILNRILPTLAIGFALSLLGTAPAGAVAECSQRPAPAPRPSSAPLAIGMTVIADEGLSSPLFAALRPPSGAPMGVHLYTSYEDPQLPTRLAAIRAYHAAGYQTLLTIHANASNGVLTPSMYSDYITQVLQQTGATLNAVEITNEGNVPGSPETSDGSNPLIIEDLIAGVETAKNYARAHDPNVAIGFNWVFDYHLDLNDFWQQLKLQATPTFLHDVDFLGLHTYPNLGSAATPVNDSTNSGEIDALQTARCEMTYLGLPTTVPIDITEVGYPVSSPADYATQADYWSRVLNTIYAYRANDGIRSVYIFRFPPTVSAASADFGIVNADGAARPSYDVIKASIAKFDPATRHRSAPHPHAPLIRRATVIRDALVVSVRTYVRLTVFVGDRRIRSFRARPGHTYRIALHLRPGRIRVLAVTAGRRQGTTVKRP